MSEYIVYIHTNKINNKKYVGITCQKPEQRWRHGEGYKSSTHFYSSIQKYGWDNFDHEIVAQGLTEEEAKSLEKTLISKYNSRDDECGYNITPGGDGYSGEDNPWYGHHHTEEARKEMSEKRKGRKVSDETKKIMSNIMAGREFSEETHEKMRTSAQKRVKTEGENHPFHKFAHRAYGENNHFYGKPMSDEKKQFLIQYHKDHFSGENNPRARKVLCVETGEIFTTLQAAAKQYHCSAGRLGNACRNSENQYIGHHWMFVDDKEGGVANE